MRDRLTVPKWYMYLLVLPQHLRSSRSVGQADRSVGLSVLSERVSRRRGPIQWFRRDDGVCSLGLGQGGTPRTTPRDTSLAITVQEQLPGRARM